MDWIICQGIREKNKQINQITLELIYSESNQQEYGCDGDPLTKTITLGSIKIIDQPMQWTFFRLFNERLLSKSKAKFIDL